jgi:hypothetical protein
MLVSMATGKPSETAKKLGIQADRHGVRMGWFCWPDNFDPVWLLNCEGFTPNETSKNQTQQT